MSNRTGVYDGAERLLELARERLREFAITLEKESPAPSPDAGIDWVVALSKGDTTVAYSAQVTASMTLTSVAAARSAGVRPLLVIGERISRRSADAFREAGIQFIDALGNAFISFGDVLIDVRGRVGTVDRARVDPPRSSSTNLFSRGRAQVILALTAWPELADARRRDVANAAGTSLGQAQDALSKLDEAGFLLANRFDELLDLWTAAYPAGLGRRLEIARFHGDPGRRIESSGPAYLSGETAEGIDLARPATCTVYLQSLDPKLAIANRWSKNPDQASNIFVRRKFWTSPRPAEEDPATKTQNAPWPLVYADLKATGDARLAEVARTWRAEHARPGRS